MTKYIDRVPGESTGRTAQEGETQPAGNNLDDGLRVLCDSGGGHGHVGVPVNPLPQNGPSLSSVSVRLHPIRLLMNYAL